jgi:hypothetical protein
MTVAPGEDKCAGETEETGGINDCITSEIYASPYLESQVHQGPLDFQ